MKTPALAFVVSLILSQVAARGPEETLLRRYPDALAAARKAARAFLGRAPADEPSVGGYRRGDNETRIRFLWRDSGLWAEYVVAERRVDVIYKVDSGEGPVPPESGMPSRMAIEAAWRFSSQIETLDGTWRVVQTSAVPGDRPAQQWNVVLMQTVGGHPAFTNRISCRVDMGSRKVISWRSQRSICLERSNRNPILEREALQIARRALDQCGAPADTELAPEFSEVGNLGWVRVAPRSPLCGLAYRFYFRFRPESGQTPHLLEAVVDAKTGELWRVEYRVGDISPVDVTKARPSPRMKLAADLLVLASVWIAPAPRTDTTPLVRALLTASPARRLEAAPTGVPLSGEAGTIERRMVEMVYQRPQMRLSWKDEDGAWWRVDLTTDGVAQVEAYLKSLAAPQ